MIINEDRRYLEFIDKLSEFLDMQLTVLKPLHARKGCSYKIKGDNEEMMIKMMDLLSDETKVTNRAHALKKEAKILRDVNQFTGDLFVASGELDSIFWLLRRWIDGVTVTHHCSYLREKPLSIDHKRQFIQDLCKMLENVVHLYKCGYLHGDLQPKHFVVDKEENFHLIDLETAVNVNHPNSDYRGGMVHYVPPETTTQMMDGNANIPLDAISEIYSFGAVAFFLYTGKTPVVYVESLEEEEKIDLKAIPFEQKLLAVSQGRIRSFEQAGAEPFPELERILMKCLEKDRTKRYQTFGDLNAALEELL
ncbi:protein kinase domain-containing protein [Lihuaxuella thermophila]|uniref:Protein kinase domain-containing protein n=1 Tax=Lihuaxuella thermophila TaxID=1173111 RepID=A0A1H8D6J4_9BACL|nr:protein kinase [Lihuaxuella thermophila]SEN02920.1 Protein kinase domain-containing protein [Lihuaxuella thermophila]